MKKRSLLFREKEAKSFCACCRGLRKLSFQSFLVLFFKKELFFCLLFPSGALAQTADAPMRDFSTDRPGKASNPVTLDAGHVQIESDIFNYVYDHWSAGGITTETRTYGAPELKVGMTNWAELAVVLPLYTVSRQTDRSTGVTTRASGLGDLQLGGKVNFFGDGGGSALGALLFVKAPTAARGLGNNMVEGTLSVPYSVGLPAGFGATVEPVFGLAREANAQGYAGDYAFLVSVNHPLWVSTVTGAVEFAADYSTDPGTGTRDTVDLTVQWQPGKTWQLDAAVYVGVTKAAPDINPYVGVSYRF